MLELYNQVCKECSQLITNRYSTSFSLGIKLFHEEIRSPIYSIYGFVRFADEIVDTFHQHDKDLLLADFRDATFKAIDSGISLNPVLHSFQKVVHTYGIANHLVEAFLDSMAMDLQSLQYDQDLYDRYIYGSAEVVGLMCLRVFTKNDQSKYDELSETAKALGSAFQKINFLRDIKDDYYEKGRLYFPNIDLHSFNKESKSAIEEDIEKDFAKGYEGILQLPKSARFGVFIAYTFYHNLLKKIRSSSFETLLNQRVRIKNRRKAYLLAKYSLKNSLHMI